MSSGAIAVTLRAPVAAMAVRETERVTNAIGAILAAPLSTSLAAVETERVSLTIGATLAAPSTAFVADSGERISLTIGAALSSPISAVIAAMETERVWLATAATLRAPRSYSVGNTIPQNWRFVPRSRSAMPRLYARHQRYGEMGRSRYGAQKQAFLAHQTRRMGMDNATAFKWLSKCTAAQMIAAESAADLETDWGDVS